MLTVTEYCRECKMCRKGKDIRKKETSNFKASVLLASDTIGRRTWQNVNSKRRLQRIQNLQDGKRHYKIDTSKF
jgi:hypothetical protein